jgi:hypothetical protein
MAQLHREGQSKITPICMTPKPDSRLKLTARHGQKTDTNKVSCFICGGPHYTKECPPKNQKAAQGYAVQITEEGNSALMNDVEMEHHSTGSVHNGKSAQSPEPDSPDLGNEHNEYPEGEQYNPDKVNAYQFSSSDDSEHLYSQATQIIATSTLNKIESQAVKASKPMLPKAPNLESNQAWYKAIKGLQPQHMN